MESFHNCSVHHPLLNMGIYKIQKVLSLKLWDFLGSVPVKPPTQQSRAPPAGLQAVHENTCYRNVKQRSHVSQRHPNLSPNVSMPQSSHLEKNLLPHIFHVCGFSRTHSHSMKFLFSLSFFCARPAIPGAYGGSWARVEWELQLPAYATATQDPSCTCNLHNSSQQHQIQAAPITYATACGHTGSLIH